MSRRTKLLHIVLICALTISIALNMHQFYLLHASAKIDIVGTFAQMDVSPPAVKYFVFLSDGQYVLYQNSTVLDNGVYSVHPEDSKLFELESSKNKKACVVWTAANIYFGETTGNAAAFQKIDEDPIFAGVDPGPYINP